MSARRTNALDDLIGGAIAGAVATWTMGKATTYLYDREATPAREAEDRARGNTTAYGVAADKAAHLLGAAQLTDEQRAQYGSAIHWALGVGAGAAYGALRPKLPGAGLARGLLFGTAFFLLVDEGANTALGLTPGPTSFPWQAHARGLAGHLVFGTVAEAALAVVAAA